MKLLGSLLALASSDIAFTVARSPLTPALPDMTLIAHSNNLKFFTWKQYEERTRLALERLLAPLPGNSDDQPVERAEFSKSHSHFCLDMPLVVFEAHPKAWMGGHLNVCCGVVRDKL